ncbi:MAG: DUF4846 domain-containing protein [Deltaproteobacteria bacterium]|nr:DUF4846 domain-containing protein [Deltaproteobacteria bacterium]
MSLPAMTLVDLPRAFAVPTYEWPHNEGAVPLDQRIPPPDGFVRIALREGSFGAWLRKLPTKPADARVHLFDGRLKRNQAVQAAVIDMDVGTRDLQQCADAVIRIRAEYLWSVGGRDAICFHFTSGHRVAWRDWALGMRPTVDGQNVAFRLRAKPNRGYANFRTYLDTVFTYAGTRSLRREMQPVSSRAVIDPGDVFVEAGAPGHAVIVLDAAVDSQDEQRRVVLLGQSYMPAQEIHVLKVLGHNSPWLIDDRSASADSPIETPEWRFTRGDLRRFKRLSSCDAER